MTTEEGDQVVTPSILGGKVGEVVNTTEWDGEKHCSVHDGDKRNDNIPVGELVKVDKPIRVRVSRQCYAESLVALSREHGFGCQQSEDEIIRRSVHNTAGHDDHIQLFPDDKRISVDDWYDFDLTYAQDLPQIEGWLEANSESEDECELCKGTEVIEPDNTHKFPCPRCVEIDYMDEYKKLLECTNCTDESEEYDEPQPEDEEWRMAVEDYFHDGEVEPIPELGLQYGINHVTSHLCAYIDELEEQLQDVREERDELKSRLRTAKDNCRIYSEKYDSLQERIEEAREKVEGVLNSEYGVGELDNALKILTPESDEGDGCE